RLRFARAAAGMLLILLAACSGAPSAAPSATLAPATRAAEAPTATPAGATAVASPTTEPASPTPALVARPATRLELRTVNEAGKLFGLQELEIETDGVALNRFDPAQSDLSVRFTAPSGQEILAPAFSYQDFDPQTLRPNGAPTWRVRFTPNQAGQWQARAELKSPRLTSQPLSFMVAADPGAHGFVRVNSIAAFLKDEDLSGLAPAKPQLAPEGATVLALQSQDRALAWVRSNAYDVAAASAAYQRAKQAGQAGADGRISRRRSKACSSR
ncbi:MAG TPA: DUF5060 domain-containing protein, partial [Roseiflexaceae bacterium]|nr:DUF5060 domain-containing protein [Roseiflexaceae bacterium]